MTNELDDLHEKSHQRLRMPDLAARTLDHYLHLQIDSAECTTPYHINPGLFSRNRALIGKGNPADIEATATSCFKSLDMHTRGEAARLKAYLVACGIGVDCSGFVSHILGDITKEKLGKPLPSCLRFPGFRGRLTSKMRPIENISARLLTNPLNTAQVNDLNKLKPGDLIRVLDGSHILIITEVGLNKDRKVNYFEYAHSSCRYGAESGARTGYCVIKNPTGLLADQQWFDNYPKSIIEEMIADGNDDSRMVRLKVFR